MQQRNTTHLAANGAVMELLSRRPPQAFDELLDHLADSHLADTQLLRHLLDVGMRRGDVEVLVAMGANPGPWYTSGTGRPSDPWGGLTGTRIHHRTGHGRDGAWVQATSPYRLRHLRLVERDGTHCRLCGRPMPPDYPPEQDHNIPRSTGGSNALDNLQLAHKVCNMVKGARAGWRLPESDEVTVWFDPVDGSWREVLSREVYA